MPYYLQLPNGDFITDIPDSVPQDQVMKWAGETMPEAFAGASRTFGEAATDVGAAALQGLGSVMQLPGQISDLLGATRPGEDRLGVQGAGERLEKWAQEQKSLPLRGRQAAQEQRVAQAEGEGAKLWQTLKGTATDLPLLVDFLAQNVANLGAIGVGGGLTKAAAKALLADATEQAVRKVGVQGALATGAAMQGADVGSETYERIYDRLVKEGVSEEQAYEQAIQGARIAAVESAALSLAASRLPGGREIEKALVGGKLPGVAQLRKVVAQGGVGAAAKKGAGIVGGTVGEATSEGIEEGGGRFISNVNVSDVFPDQSLVEGTGQATGQGVLIGGAFGAGAGAITSSRDRREQSLYDQAIKDIEAARAAEAGPQLTPEQRQAQAQQASLAADNIPTDPREAQSRFRYGQQQGDLFGEFTTGQPASQYQAPDVAPAARIVTEDGQFDVDGQGRLSLPDLPNAPATPVLYVAPDSARVAQQQLTQPGMTTALGFINQDNTFQPVETTFDIPAGAQPAVGVIDTNSGRVVDAFKADPVPTLGRVPAIALPDAQGQKVQFGTPVREIQPLTPPVQAQAQVQGELPATQMRVIDESALDRMGIPKRNQKLRAELVGKDMNNPQEYQQVLDLLNAYGESTSSPKVATQLEAYLNSPEARQTPYAGPEPVADQAWLDAIGVPKQAAMRRRLNNADLNDPVQRQRVYDDIRAYGDRTQTEAVRGQINAFLRQVGEPPLAERRRPGVASMTAARPIAQTAPQVDTTPTPMPTQGVANVSNTGQLPSTGALQPTVDGQTDQQGVAVDKPRRRPSSTQAAGTSGVPAPAGTGLADTTARVERSAGAVPVQPAPLTQGEKSPKSKVPLKVVDANVTKTDPTTADQEAVAQAIESDLDKVIQQVEAALDGKPKPTVAKKPVTAEQVSSWYAARVVDSMTGKWREPNTNPREMYLRLIAADMHMGGSDTAPTTPRLFQYSTKRAKKVYAEVLTDAERAQVDKLLASLEKEAAASEAYLKGYNTFQAQIASYGAPDTDADMAKVRRAYQGQTSRMLIHAMVSGSPEMALREIIRNPKFHPRTKQVARRLQQYGQQYGYPSLSLVDRSQLQAGADGQYNAVTDTVEFAVEGADAHVLLHEMVHGFLHSAITRAEATGKWDKNLSKLRDLYDRVKAERIAADGTYGMSSLTEFVSEALSNSEFQALLSSVPYFKTVSGQPGRQSLWGKLKSLLRQALGIAPPSDPLTSVLDEIMFAADRAMPAGRAVQKRRIGIAGRDAVVAVNRAGHDVLMQEAGYTPGFLATQGVKPPSPDPLIERAKQSTRAWVDSLETRWFSADAALNNAVRREIVRDKPNWDIVKDTMLKMATSQAVHANATANVFLDMGNLQFDAETHKWMGVADDNSWRSIIQDIQAAANRYSMPFDEFRAAVHVAFVAERTRALKETMPTFQTSLTDAQIDAGMAFFQMYPELQQIRDKWNALRKNAIDIGVRGGLFTREYADALLEAGEYVPFDRVQQVEAGAVAREASRNLSSFAKPKKIKGSQEQEINDVFDNMERWAAYTVASAVRNRQAVQMYRTAKELFPDEVQELAPDAPTKKEDNTSLIWVDGVRKKVKFEDPLWVEAFAGIEGVAIPVNKFAVAMSNFLRKNVVLYPLFSISQLSQDAVSAVFTSGLRDPFKLPLEVVKEFVKTLRGTSATHKDLYRYGVVGVMDATAPMADELGIDTGLRKPSRVAKALRPLEKFAMASDNAVRQAVARRTLLETGGVELADGTIVGGDRAAAAERAFEIINFKRSGSSRLMNVMRQVIPFFNAYLQSINVLTKVLVGRGISPNERREAYRRLMATTAKVSALAFMYTALASDDDEYKNMDPAIRDRHLVIPGTGVMIPLRSDLTLLPKLMAEYTYLLMTDHGTTDGTKARRAIGQALVNAAASPTVAPQAVKPLLEVYLNHSFFTGRPIVGAGLADAPKDLQFSTNTSELAKILSKALPFSPMEVDHLIRGYGGTTSGLITTTAEVGAILANPDLARTPRSGRDIIASFPGLSAFYAREQGTGMKNDFYELRAEVTEAVKGLNILKKDAYKPEEARAFAERNANLLRVKSQVNTIERQLTLIRNRKKQLDQMPMSVMSAPEKIAEIRRLNDAENRMLSNVKQLRQLAGL